jgi:hypothetical protein
MASNYRKMRRLLIVIFLASLLFCAFLILNASGDINPPSNPNASQTALIIALVISLLTSIGSLLGFISTTILAWKKERREARTGLIDDERRKLELEKLKAELAKTKGQDS